MIPEHVLQKYNVPTPRYTSYPTVPLWDNNLEESSWITLVKKAYKDFGEKEGINLYIHLPYCESLCTYCGCNKRITKNHQVELPYIQTVLQEWQTYLKILPQKPRLAGIHLGGGTPTFFSPAALTELLSAILSSSEVMHDAEFSFEGHPNNTTVDHLQTLRRLGFSRISYGIQDFDITVQKAINRIQPFEKVKEATDKARESGYSSVNFDLIYGLPYQTPDTIRSTFAKVAELKPDRIAFYSYAHVPKVFPAQRHYEAFLPQEAEKRLLYDIGKKLLIAMGYQEVGMDHFSLPDDPLYIAKRNRQLHRNFMGYTTSPSRLLIGLGNSSISDINYAYAQNVKEIEPYKARVQAGRLAINKGHIQTPEDKKTRDLILSIICQEQAAWEDNFYSNLPSSVLKQLKELADNGLITVNRSGLKVTTMGKGLIRNICAVFDQRMHEKQSMEVTFSKSV